MFDLLRIFILLYNLRQFEVIITVYLEQDLHLNQILLLRTSFPFLFISIFIVIKGFVVFASLFLHPRSFFRFILQIIQIDFKRFTISFKTIFFRAYTSFYSTNIFIMFYPNRININESSTS